MQVNVHREWIDQPLVWLTSSVTQTSSYVELWKLESLDCCSTAALLSYLVALCCQGLSLPGEETTEDDRWTVGRPIGVRVPGLWMQDTHNMASPDICWGCGWVQGAPLAFFYFVCCSASCTKCRSGFGLKLEPVITHLKSFPIVGGGEKHWHNLDRPEQKHSKPPPPPPLFPWVHEFRAVGSLHLRVWDSANNYPWLPANFRKWRQHQRSFHLPPPLLLSFLNLSEFSLN